MKKYLSLLLAGMMVLSNASFAAPKMADTAVDTSELFEAPVSETVVVEEAELESEDYGVLIAEIDFENAEVGTTIEKDKYTAPVSAVGTANLPEGFPQLYLNITQGTLTVAQDEDGNKYGEWVLTAPGYAKLGFYTNGADEGNKLMPAGHYTLVADYEYAVCKDAEGNNVTPPDFNSVFTPNKPDGGWTNGEANKTLAPSKTANEDGTTTITAGYGFYEGQLITAAGVHGSDTPYPFVGLGKATYYIDKGGSYFADATIKVDNYKLYYKAPDTKVTIDDGDPNTENKVFNIVAGKQSIDLTPYALESDDTKAYTGYKVEGTTDSFTSFAPTEAGEYTLVPGYNYYAPGIGFEGTEFETAADFHTLVANANGVNSEKPASGNPAVSVSVDPEADTVIIDAKFAEGTSLPAFTQVNAHLNQQINAQKPLSTNAIKGVEYKFRLIAPENAENVATYFSEQGIFTKVYFKVNWPEGVEQTPCYGTTTNGWHWGECVGFPLTLHGAGKEYNGEWLTAKFDLDSLHKAVAAHNNVDIYYWKDADLCTDFRIQFLQAYTKVAGDYKIEVDYVRFILADDIVSVTPELVSYDFYDLRKGYFDLTFAEELEGINADEVYQIVNGTEFVASELVSTEGGATYRIYAGKNLNGVTVSFNNYAYTSTGVINTPAALKALNHTYTLAEVAEKGDGENLFPNGDFSNPYYNVFTADGTIMSVELDDSKVVATLTENATEWNTLTAEGVLKLNTNTHYYIDIDASFITDAENNPHATQPDIKETSAVYFPVLDGTTSLVTNKLTEIRISKRDYIPATNCAGAFYFGQSTLGKAQNVTRVMEIMDADYYANTENVSFSTGSKNWAQYSAKFFDKASLYIQPCLTTGINAGIFARVPDEKGTNRIPAAKGLQYVVNSVVIKEMFPITLVDGETVIDTLYAAKDVTIVLPAADKYVTPDGKRIAVWQSEAGTYAPGDEFTLTEPEGMTLTAVKETAPLTDNSVSIRTDAYTGIRFKASVSNILKADEKTAEFGYIVTRKSLLDAAGISVNDFTSNSDVKFITGKNYVKAENIDKIFENNGTFNYFTAVVYNIPAEQYDDILVAKPYVLHDNVKYFGDPVVASLRSAATAVKNSAAYDELTEDAKAVVDGIVG